METKKLWLWQNFVNGRPEYWAFDNAYPCHPGPGDPITLGEPAGYALVMDSVCGRPYSEDDVIADIVSTNDESERALRAQIAKLQAFKDYVHKRLDDAGVPTHPDGEHSKAGCRIGDRLDIALTATHKLGRVREGAELLRSINNAAGHSEIIAELLDEILREVGAVIERVICFCKGCDLKWLTNVPRQWPDMKDAVNPHPQGGLYQCARCNTVVFGAPSNRVVGHE